MLKMILMRLISLILLLIAAVWGLELRPGDSLSVESVVDATADFNGPSGNKATQNSAMRIGYCAFCQQQYRFVRSG